MDDLPGQYPITPGVATPDEVNMHKDQRNKLHKPQDPPQDQRGHGYSDSGVGLTERDRVGPFIGDESQRRGDYSEAVGGGLYAREKNPLDSHDSTAAQPALSHDATRESLNGAAYAPETVGALFSREKAPAPFETEAQKLTPRAFSQDTPRENGSAFTADNTAIGQQRTSTAADDNVEPRAQPRASGSNTPPYWGSLPKAASGGIYNTVTGHGSPGDDHDQHHGLPARPTEPETSHVAGNAADYPQTGVHNGVIGHGSQDEESMRHAQHSSGRAFAAPLPGVPEHQSTSPKNDVLVNDFGSDIASPKASSPPQIGTLISGAALSGVPANNDSTAPRAFPLTDKEHTDKTLTSERSDSHTKEALLAGVAGAGTGIAASELADKHKHRHRNDEDSTIANRGVSQDAAASKDKHSPLGAIAGVLPHRQKQEKEPKEASPVKKKKSREDNPPQVQGEKRHHRILGIFHRHKDDKDSDETLASEPQNDAAGPQSRHEKEKIAAGAAAGATGASVLRKHSKDDKESNKSPQSGSSPRGNDVYENYRLQQAAIGDEDNSITMPYDAKMKSSTGAVDPVAVPSRDKHDGMEENSRRQQVALGEEDRSITKPYDAKMKSSTGAVDPVAVPFRNIHDGMEENYRGQPAALGEEDRSITKPYDAKMKSSTGAVDPVAVPFRNKHDGMEENYRGQATALGEEDRSITKPYDAKMRSSVGAADPIAAPIAERHVQHTGSLPSPDTYSTGSPAHAPATTRQAETSRESQDNESSRAKPLLAAGAGAAAAGAYMHSRREGSPKAKGEHEQQPSAPFRSTGQSQSGNASNESGSYNTLATGTPSGLKTDSSNTAVLETRDGATNEPGNYKALASGTSSGVKTGSSALGSAADKDRAASDSGPVQDKTGRSTGPYNVLPSGTPSGVKVQPSQRRRSEDTYAQRQDESNTQATGTKSGTDHGFGSNRVAQNAPHIAAIPYTSPRTESTPEEPLLDTSHMGARNDVAIRSREHSSSQMSPEVMPVAYTATTPRSTPAPGTSQDTAVPVTRSSPSPTTSEKDSATPVPPKHGAQGFSERYQTARSSGQGMAPALAAATGAWATSAGASSGAAPHDTASSDGAPKVVHKCHNCGVDNDISSYFNKDAQPKPSGTGFW
ncbi:hypothetical protein B0T26DRAFT_714619 [Lasiosphaeria miniovina]|uniref:Uncharacterized protein n=1 Tax=Lasiosphaeria miniovina TaxID=1954250 RepID=A0AA40DQP0_9PEZI|nr:uncharacterized protein B0T26DRAFT_714619 [Lasiosphaeria miniovina]KAK0712564.1 hypothetical protein B0T26DRAFT_714619 [Lasiosphaeria miniovina]